MQLSITSLIIAILCTSVACTTVQSLTFRGLGRVHHTARELKKDKFVTDPSANVKGIFKKEGDMTFIMHTDLLSEEGKRKKRNAVLDTKYLWPGGIIPYEISSYFNEQEERLILSAMSHWENKTCIRFRPKNSTDQYWTFIMSGSVLECQSFVGRVPNVTLQPQGVTLGPGCVKYPTVLHELGHVIGFYHEHSRPDRNEHIEVKYDNVIPAFKSEFDRLKPGTTNLLGYGYDHASIMHYDRDQFSVNGNDTIVSKDPSVPIGGALELSPLDILKTNKLYNCGLESTWPPVSTVLPSLPTPAPPSLPIGITCGQVSNGKLNGTYTSPGYPSYQHNLDCAYVIKVPQGYNIRLEIRHFAIEQSVGCSIDYVEIYDGTNLVSNKIVNSSYFQQIGLQTPEGRLCDNRGYTLIINIPTDVITLYFHTSGSGRRSRGLYANFTAVDINECPHIERTFPDCHQCNNLPGGFVCDCRDGYYHSAAALTCYDVNECAYDNGGCQHKCINSGGFYRCECNSGYYLQADKKSCIPDDEMLCLPDGITCCQVSNGQMSGAYTSPGYPFYQHNLDCTYVIRAPNGYSIQLVIHNFDIEKSAECSKDFVEVYTRRRLTNWQREIFSVYTNHDIQTQDGRMCDERGITLIINSISDYMLVYIHTDESGSGRNSKGLNVTFTAVDVNECDNDNGGCDHTCINVEGSYRCECNSGYYLQLDNKTCERTPPVTAPPLTTTSTSATTPPPTIPPLTITSTTPPSTTLPSTTTLTFTTTPPPPQCGGLLTTSSGTFQTPNWPETYPNNIDCEWRIQLPDVSKVVEISCEEEPFGIAGSLPACEKDFLKFFDGHSRQDTEFGPFCFFKRPGTTIMSSNKAMAVFHSGPRHSSSRRGFKCSFQSIDVPQCGGTLTAASGSFQTLNWPKTYPININCTWTIILPDSSQRVEITFDSPFGIAGSLPTCKDKLHVYDDNTGTRYGPYCYFTVPNPPTMSSNRATVVFVAGPSHSPSRVGFRATYRSVA